MRDVGANLARSAGAVLVASSTAVVLVGAAVLVFLNPVWVGLEQARTRADVFTGYSLDEVHRVTDAVLGELILGPATFLQQIQGAAVFDPRERQHLADVRGVLMGFAVLLLAAVLALASSAWKARDRAWLWRSVAGGAMTLAGMVVVVGTVFAISFDAAFELFHRLLFAGGSYAFDPRNDRLVQLFPEDFWAETSIALAVTILVFAVMVSIAARRLAEAHEAVPTDPGRIVAAGRPIA